MHLHKDLCSCKTDKNIALIGSNQVKIYPNMEKLLQIQEESGRWNLFYLFNNDVQVDSFMICILDDSSVNFPSELYISGNLLSAISINLLYKNKQS